MVEPPDHVQLLSELISLFIFEEATLGRGPELSAELVTIDGHTYLTECIH